MNRRCLAYPNDQWIRIPVDGGPFHRQYRHQQNVHRDANQRRPRLDTSEAESTAAPTSMLEKPKSPTGRPLSSGFPGPTHRLQARGNNLPINGRVRTSHNDSEPRGIDFSIQHNPMRPTKYSPNGDSKHSGVVTKRVLWFRANDDQRPKVVTLLDRFDHAGLDVQVFNVFEGHNPFPSKLTCSLIMLECVDTIEQEMLTRLDSVRSKSKAPLIILTDNATLDWSLLALREGADAIFTMNTPDEIILARSNALLRRWSVE